MRNILADALGAILGVAIVSAFIYGVVIIARVVVRFVSCV